MVVFVSVCLSVFLYVYVHGNLFMFECLYVFEYISGF